MTAKEAASRLGVGLSTVYQLCEERRLGHARVGAGRGRITIEERDVLAYLADCRVEARREDGRAPAPPPPAQDWRAALERSRARGRELARRARRGT